MPTILIASQDKRLAARLEREFVRAGLACSREDRLDRALTRLAGLAHDDLLVDIALLGAAPRPVIHQLRAVSPGARIIVISSTADIPRFAHCVRDNLVSVLPKPVRHLDRLIARLTGPLTDEAEVEAEALEDQASIVAAGHGIVHASQAMKAALGMALVAARTSDPVVLLGETGTGKDLVARLIHNIGPRRAGPFIPVNCASLADEIADAELFGRTRGAFTGATDRRDGLFHHAHGGTLFLDEIGELSPRVEAKLLRVLQDGEVRMVGSSRTARVDVRVIAASNRELAGESNRAGLRLDLYHRLACHVVRLPPLRARAADIPLLAWHFLAEADSAGLCRGLAPDAVAALAAHAWPGNVRELRLVVRHAAALARGRRVGVSDVHATIGEVSPGQRPNPTLARGLLSLGLAEREALIRALELSQGNVTAAARLLGIGRATFFRKLAGVEAARHGA